MIGQLTLTLDASDEVAEAFVDGRLYVEIDPTSGRQGRRFVHVISRPAHGEIRGYEIVDGALHIREPNYTGDWPELDAEVSRRVGMPLHQRRNGGA